MIVGAALVEIHVHGSQSLKQKRGVVRSIVQRVRNRFNVSVVEVGGQDTWQRCVLGIAAAGADEARLRGVLRRVCEFIEDLHLAEVLGTDVEVVALAWEGGFSEPDPWEPGADDGDGPGGME
ncbi:MAG: DUF503 domain-containing protein [Myxococcota bacterium]|nr:DUF503 domain-containing protein [Myxococcota bacterium]